MSIFVLIKCLNLKEYIYSVYMKLDPKVLEIEKMWKSKSQGLEIWKTKFKPPFKGLTQKKFSVKALDVLLIRKNWPMLTKNTFYSMLNNLFDWEKKVKFKACILQQKVRKYIWLLWFSKIFVLLRCKILMYHNLFNHMNKKSPIRKL